jgi:hypothetical protein
MIRGFREMSESYYLNESEIEAEVEEGRLIDSLRKSIS